MSDQQNTLTVTNAGLFVRLAALLYDALLVLALWFVIGVIFVMINGGEHVDTHNPFLPSALFIATLWFNMHFWRRGGQTLGMRAWRLRLLNQNKGPLTLTQCLLRFVVAIGSFGLCLLGYLWIFIDKNGFTWHDKYSETRVIREPKK
ncbi:RDD family protein [Pseudomonas sp. HK3]|jgi:uncharacterized RDD family membrane protein YckC